MRVPAFFDEVPDIVMADPLAALLGAAEQGRIEYRYIDAVKLAGHSCPTVASAWLLTARALARLYPDTLPQRGGIRVELRRAQDDSATGVVGSVVGLVTGAAGAGGFKGIGGLHARRDLLRYGAPIDTDLRFTRLDRGRVVGARFHGERVPMPDDLRALLAYATTPGMDAATLSEFARRWQGWVRAILIDHRDDPALVELTEEAVPA